MTETPLYQTFEKAMVSMVLALILALIVVIFSLIVVSINEMVNTGLEYYEIVDVDEQACLDFGERTGSEVQWRDETFFGFGPDGSYGCYLLKETPDDTTE